MFVVLAFCIYYLLKRRGDFGDASSIVSLVLMVLIILLSIPIGGLTIFHLLLIVRGRTTNEQVTGKFKSNVNPVRDLLSPSAHRLSVDRLFSSTTVGWGIVDASSSPRNIPSRVSSRPFTFISDLCLDWSIHRGERQQRRRRRSRNRSRRRRSTKCHPRAMQRGAMGTMRRRWIFMTFELEWNSFDDESLI